MIRNPKRRLAPARISLSYTAAMKILVVDDSATNRFILEQALNEAGYEVVCAHDGADGLQKVRAEKFDLVITDLLMPRLDGFQFCQAIKNDEALGHLPVLVCTSTYTDSKDEALARDLGADGFITKSLATEDLIEEVRSVIARGSGRAPAGSKPLSDETTQLRQYNGRLICKLEDKLAELDAANKKMAELNTTLERRVQAGLAELSEANRELEAFVYSVAHDLRSPLRAIQGFSNILLSDPADGLGEKQKGFLQRINRSARQLDVLTGDLLAYSKLKNAQIELVPVELDRVVARAREILSHQIEDSKAEIVLDGPMPVVLAHESALDQVVTNLLGNAVKYVAPGTLPKIQITARNRAGWARVAIADNGIGIAPENHERIFKVFERLDHGREYAGTGVGLAIVQKAVQKMGGRIGVESNAGEGSTFWVELPVPERIESGA